MPACPAAPLGVGAWDAASGAMPAEKGVGGSSRCCWHGVLQVPPLSPFSLPDGLWRVISGELSDIEPAQRGRVGLDGPTLLPSLWASSFTEH